METWWPGLLDVFLLGMYWNVRFLILILVWVDHSDTNSLKPMANDKA